MDILAGPAVETRSARHTLGIRIVTPFRGMLAQRDALLDELYDWVDAHDVPVAETFLRLHVIDMEGPMDLEVGALVPEASAGDDRVRPGVLPAGDYATLTYRDHARRANGYLQDWARDNGVVLDRRGVPAGDEFACRYEAYLTDPRTEPRKTRWIVQLNMLTRQAGGLEE
ncbi:MAG TPA: GyrI-like domain-containing protein [Devosia sp.]